MSSFRGVGGGSSSSSSGVPLSKASSSGGVRARLGASQKWIEPGANGLKDHLRVSDCEVFRDIGSAYCNLISIFGRARQGKSFLMNYLAGESDIFKISNSKDPCTQGIDISATSKTLAEFSGNGSSSRGGGGSDIRIGFVDAEGQGDRDVSYDAQLVCPILLASKVVLFNWKGDLQRDDLLKTLGIMEQAAQNVNSEQKGSKATFGHLHIVFRDWQAVESDPAEVLRDFMAIEVRL